MTLVLCKWQNLPFVDVLVFKSNDRLWTVGSDNYTELRIGTWQVMKLKREMNSKARNWSEM